ncbi:MAG: hypothetical protein N2038_13700 [Geminicoccaceae bacterium]|nr:hypothetical protein [Geminicoccaceae bacterium]MCX7631289.1 hypothetical protein [Geminicoccaceae bacterium]MDW8340325.1 hypothetical protein [Geminicoccaceae bacterium]
MHWKASAEPMEPSVYPGLAIGQVLPYKPVDSACQTTIRIPNRVFPPDNPSRSPAKTRDLLSTPPLDDFQPLDFSLGVPEFPLAYGGAAVSRTSSANARSKTNGSRFRCPRRGRFTVFGKE